MLNPDGDLFFCENSDVVGNVTKEDPEAIYFREDAPGAPRHIRDEKCPGCLSPCQMNVAAIKQVVPYARFLVRASKEKRRFRAHVPVQPRRVRLDARTSGFTIPPVVKGVAPSEDAQALSLGGGLGVAALAGCRLRLLRLPVGQRDRCPAPVVSLTNFPRLTGVQPGRDPNPRLRDARGSPRTRPGGHPATSPDSSSTTSRFTAPAVAPPCSFTVSSANGS